MGRMLEIPLKRKGTPVSAERIMESIAGAVVCSFEVNGKPCYLKYGSLPVEQVKEKMRGRAKEMPREDVVVYCVSCIKSMHIGGKRPRYVVDLLFGQETQPREFEPDVWHGSLKKYIEAH
jgi:hypothetical protein